MHIESTEKICNHAEEGGKKTNLPLEVCLARDLSTPAGLSTPGLTPCGENGANIFLLVSSWHLKRRQ